MKLQLLFLTSLATCLASVQAEVSFQIDPKDNVTIAEGIASGEEIAGILVSGKFLHGGVESLRTKTGKFLSALPPLFGCIAQTQEAFDSPEVKGLLEDFERVNDKLASSFPEFEKLKKEIKWSEMEVSLAKYEMVLHNMEGILKRMFDSPHPEIRKSLIHRLQVEFRASGNPGLMLYKFVVEHAGVYTRNVVYASMKMTKFHRAKVRDFMTGTLGIVLRAAVMDVIYARFSNPNSIAADYHVDKWKVKMNSLLRKMQEYDHIVTNAWRHQSGLDLDEMLQNHQSLSDSAFTSKLWYFYKDKYPFKNWFVAVSRPSDMAMFACVHTRRSVFGRSVAVAVVLSSGFFNKQLANALITGASKHAYENTNDLHRHLMNPGIVPPAPSCSPNGVYAARIVVTGATVHAKFNSDRAVTRGTQFNRVEKLWGWYLVIRTYKFSVILFG